MSEIWSSDELMVNMGSFSESVTEYDSLLSTWLSHAIQSDDNSTGIEYNMFGKYEDCEKPMEVYATIGAYSPYFEQSLNYECSDGASGSIEIWRTSPQYNLVGSNEYIYSSLQDPKSNSSYLHEGCMNSCPFDHQSRDTSVSSSSSSAQEKDSHVKAHRNAIVAFPVGFDGNYPFATAEAFHSGEDWMENMLSASSMPQHSFSSLPAYNIVMQNVIEGEIEVAWNSEKVDEVLKSKSGGDGPICYVNQLQLENKREERYQIPINDVVVEEQHPPLKRHCSERLMADRAKVNALPAIEERINYMTMSSSSSMLASIEPTLSSTAGTAFNTDGKPRARRGSATDPQSLYARQRRERINERLKVLQNLIPNGTKVDISTMLEDAIHYVKFLQLQIKILSSDDHWMQTPIAFHAVDASFVKPII